MSIRLLKPGDKLQFVSREKFLQFSWATYAMIDHFAGKVVTFDHYEPRTDYTVFQIVEDEGNWVWFTSCIHRVISAFTVGEMQVKFCSVSDPVLPFEEHVVRLESFPE